jgi:D-alanyl-D-alanine carboxypeptidase
MMRIDAVRSTSPWGVLAVVLALVLTLASAAPASAKPAFSAIAVDAATGRIVFERAIDAPRYPASLTKVMTLYLLFEDMRAGRVTLDSRLAISPRAAAQQPSKLGLKPGQSISVKDAICALVTKSANDVAVAVAEGLAGSEAAFAQRMTRTARALGMTRTTFRNASGLPHPEQQTTARDMATLGLRIQRDFPREFTYFSMRSFRFAGASHRNHNRLLGRLEGVDGIKTGFINASGFNLITSIERGGKRMVGVVMGGQTGGARNAYMSRILNDLYRKAKLERVRSIAALAGNPPGYVGKPDEQTVAEMKPQSPPLPRRKPEVSTKDDDSAVAMTASEETTDLAEETAEEEPVIEATSFQSVVVESGSKSDSLIEEETDMIGKAAGLVAEKALQEAAEADLSDHLGSWNIQVGAFPTPEAAKSRLASAQATGIAVLDGKSAFTMPAESGGGIVYRARFSGFNEKAARLACRKLKQKGLGCLALAPRG